MEKFFVIITAIVLLFSCGNSTEQADFVTVKPELVFPVKIDVEASMSNIETLKLSSYTDEVNYVKLKTPPDVFIKLISDIQVNENKIYVQEGLSNTVMVFDMEGNFAGRIGKVGRGPNEYIILRSFCIDDLTGDLLFFTGWEGDVFRYNSNGEFIGQLFTRKLADYMAFVENKLVFSGLIGSTRNLPDYISQFAITDIAGQVIDSVPLPIYSIENWREKNLNFPGNYRATKYDGTILLYELRADTLFYTSEQSKIEPRYILNFGAYDTPNETAYISGSPELISKRNSYLTAICPPFETSQNLWWKFALKQEPFILRYDKAEQKSYVYYYSGDTKIDLIKYIDPIEDFGLLNNIDGGLDFFPQWSVYNNSTQYFVSAKDAYEMKQILTPEYYANREAIAPEKKAALIELVNNIEEKDDFVLMIVKLK